MGDKGKKGRGGELESEEGGGPDLARGVELRAADEDADDGHAARGEGARLVGAERKEERVSASLFSKIR